MLKAFIKSETVHYVSVPQVKEEKTYASYTLAGIEIIFIVGKPLDRRLPFQAFTYIHTIHTYIHTYIRTYIHRVHVQILVGCIFHRTDVLA